MNKSEPKYGIATFKDVMMPMRDGIRLATDIYRPALDGELVPGTFPTILGRTSYDKNSPQMWVEPVAEFFTRHGYVTVLQDLRGRQRSEGTGQYFHTANPNEGCDGYDTVEWIAAQLWSNGRVGTVGSSHGAIVQSVMALYQPPHLTAMWQDVGPTNIYAHEAREGGAMALHMFAALFLHAHDAQEIRDNPVAKDSIAQAMERMRELVFSTPFKPGHTPLAVVPNLEQTLFNYYYRGEYDEFWKQDCCDQERYFDRHIDAASVFSGGWYDPFSVATTNYFATMCKQNKTSQRLVMGPWNHGAMRGAGTSYVGDVDFGPDATWGDRTYNKERLRWFDRWLKDVPNGLEAEPPVRIFVMGGGDGKRNSEGTFEPRRRVAVRKRVAPCPHKIHRLLLPCRRGLESKDTGRKWLARPFHPRSSQSGANYCRKRNWVLRTGSVGGRDDTPVHAAQSADAQYCYGWCGTPEGGARYCRG